MKRCNCDFCKTYDKIRWETIDSCGCVCHIYDGIVEHENLCCGFPNGKKKDNPYKNKPIK